MKAFASLMSLVFIILVIVFDAARLKKEHSAIYQARMGSGPATWGVLTFLFSLLVLPVYLFSRNKYFLDYRALPLEERQVAGTNSFLKTCLSAKIIILWFLIVESVSLAIVFQLEEVFVRIPGRPRSHEDRRPRAGYAFPISYSGGVFVEFPPGGVVETGSGRVHGSIRGAPLPGPVIMVSDEVQIARLQPLDIRLGTPEQRHDSRR